MKINEAIKSAYELTELHDKWKPYHQLEDMFEDMLNDCYEMVSICGYDYDQGRALRQLDPIAFRCGLLDYIDNQCSDDDLIEIDGEYYDHDITDYLADLYQEYFNDYLTVEKFASDCGVTNLVAMEAILNHGKECFNARAEYLQA